MSVTWHLAGPKPYAVQWEAMRRSGGQAHYGYFLEQGLGKTALTINDYIENFSDYDTVIVICPNTFKRDWTLSPAEWGVGDSFQTAYWPNEIPRTWQNLRLYSTNFEAVRSSGYNYIREILDDRPCLLVVDESSAIKNFKSQTAKAVLDLSKRAGAVRLLNGTPMAQNPMDLFPQLKCLNQLDRVNPYQFRNHFTVMGGWMNKQIVGVRNEEELHGLLNRCSFRALKKDWSDLPPKIMVPVRLEMTDNQRRHYKQMLNDFITLVDTKEFSAQNVLAQMEKHRQISSGLLIEGEEKFALIDPPAKNPKIKAALDIYDGGTGKIIIVYFYTRMGQILLDEFQKLGFNPAYIRGGMDPEEVTDQKAKFNKDGSCRVMVAQISSSSRAHTLTGAEGGDRCSRMFFHDHTFRYIDRKQMEDRIHRGEQDQTCMYYDPILSPIDEAQVRSIDKKQDMVSLVVDAVRALRVLI